MSSSPAGVADECATKAVEEQALALVLQHGFRWDRKGSALVRSVSTSWRNVHDRLLPRLVLGGWETDHPGAFPPGGCFGGGRAVTITKRFPALSVLMIERRHGERDASCPSWLFFVQGEALCSPPPKFTELQDGDLERIATLNLTALHLDCELVSNAGVRALSSQRRLVTLSLGSEQKPLTRVTDQGLRTMLNGTTALQELMLSAIKLTDKAMLGVASLQCVRSLTLRHVKLSDLGVKAIAALPLVELFVQCGDKLTDAAAVSLSQCTTLRQLRVFMPLLTDVGISAVGQLTDLHVLALLSGSAAAATPEGVRALLSNLPALRTLELVDMGSVTDLAAAHVAALTSLQALVLRGASLSNRAAGSLGKLPLLQLLDLRGCAAVHYEAIEQFLAYMPDASTPEDNFVQIMWAAGEVYFGARGLCC